MKTPNCVACEEDVGFPHTCGKATSIVEAFRKGYQAGRESMDALVAKTHDEGYREGRVAGFNEATAKMKAIFGELQVSE